MKITLIKEVGAADLTIIPMFEEDAIVRLVKEFFDQPVLSLIQSDFQNKPGEIHLAYSNKLGRVLLLGLGKRKALSLARFRKFLQAAVVQAKSFDLRNFQIALPVLPNALPFLEMTAFASLFALYRFDYYKKSAKDTNLLSEIFIITKNNAAARQAVAKGEILAHATNRARDLANHPANVATPKHLAKHALEIADKFKIKIKILDEKQIKQEGLGLLAGISQGSDEPPRFIIMDYGPQNQQPIVLIGKGLTFDSGGMSIKPADKMDEMKFDMCGGATVLGIMEAAAKLKLKQRIVALIPSSENLLSGRAVKPGDVLNSHAGITVEVINTDAEGRMILADAISYARKYYKPKAIIDYATLTGATIIGLGDEYSACLTNTDKFNNSLTYASLATGEKIAFLPLAEEYKGHLVSGIADIRNVGEKGNAGAISAALFLERFVGDVPWVHLDTAGTSWSMKNRSHMPAGATGWGVYFSIKLLEKLRS